MEHIVNVYGRKVKYDHTVDGDGYDVVTNWEPLDDVTVIDGIEYPIADDAPTPLMFGVKTQLVSVTEQAGEEAYHTYYDYVEQQYVSNVPIPADAYPAGVSAYEPPSEDRRREDNSWHADDYRRNIVMVQQMPELVTDMPDYNYRPPVDEG